MKVKEILKGKLHGFTQVEVSNILRDYGLSEKEELTFDPAVIIELKEEGYENIIKYGISFYRKDCIVKSR